MQLQILIIALFFLVSDGCEKALDANGSYSLSTPDKTWGLKSSLVEVSGLAWCDGLIYMVADEKGTIHSFDPKDGSQKSEFKMAGKGDFEGIECAEGQLYLLRSDSKIYSASLSNFSEDEVRKSDLKISKKRNLEGMGYHPKTRQLLLSSKEFDKKSPRKLYGVNIDELEKQEDDLFEFPKDFYPAAVAVHPLTQEIFITSHPKHQLLILDQNFKQKMLISLPSLIFPQPEGICFDPDGNLYIANEGRAGRAFIHFFKKRR